MKKIKLLNSNYKLDKSKDFGYYTIGLSLAHGNTSGINVCKDASPICLMLCNAESGQNGNEISKKAKIARTHFLRDNKIEFFAQLRDELLFHKKKAEKIGLKLAVRLNVYSDLNWKAFIRNYPDIQFYDYTARIEMFENKPKNLHLTFSRKENNADKVATVLQQGYNVAVPFRVKRGQPLPNTFLGKRVIDGDLHDLRFLDDRNVIVGLRYKYILSKGNAHLNKLMNNGFVIEA